jgi:hypothetical protein
MAGRVVIALVILAAGCGSTGTSSLSVSPASMHHPARHKNAAHHKRVVHHHVHHKAALPSKNTLLCIYPGAGKAHVITTLDTASLGSWKAACAANGGYPVRRYDGTKLFLEPRSGLFYKVLRAGASGTWVVVPSKL